MELLANMQHIHIIRKGRINLAGNFRNNYPVTEKVDYDKYIYCRNLIPLAKENLVYFI